MPMRQFLPLLFVLFSVQLFGQMNTSENSRKAGISQSNLSQSSLTISNEWDEVEPYFNGFARVLQGQKFTFINQSGKAISPVIFDGARNFSGGLVTVQQDEKWGFMDEAGKMIIPCSYDVVFDFIQNKTLVSKGNSWFMVSKRNEVKELSGVEACKGFEKGNFIVVKNGMLGKLNENAQFTPTAKNNSIAAVSRQATPVTNNASSVTCPNNLDFENGNFTDWRCFTGTVDSIGTRNVITVAPSLPINNRHRIITRANPSGIDPFGLFPTNPPDGSNFAVRLGNTNIGAQAERITYTIRVPLNDSNFSIKYDYAVVFQDPNHTTWSQPRFVARLFDSAANAYVNCASFEYISTSNLPGFARSVVDTSVIYKPWASVFIGLGAFAGKTIYLEFTTADCVRRGHWGYAYLDVEGTCGQSVVVDYDCAAPHVTTLDAPPGFQTYTWWNQNYSAVVASGAHAVLNPGPANPTTLMLEMIPFNGFGCRDTLAVRLSGGLEPEFHASLNQSYCAPHQVSFYNHNLPSVLASWNFGDGTTGTGDTVTHTYVNPGTYIVTMTVVMPNGCTGSLTDTIVIVNPVASWNYTGGVNCQPTFQTWTINAPGATSFVWNFGDGTSATTSNPTISHSYSVSGNYLPSVVIQYPGGCTKSLSASVPLVIENITPSFTYQVQSSCGASLVSFTNTTSSTSGFAQVTWNFGDGTTGTGNNVTHTYTTPGVKLVKIIIRGMNGCLDSIVRAVQPNIWIVPSGNISGPASACPNDTASFTHTYNNADSVVSLIWTSTTGATSTLASPSFVFDQPGNYQVQLVVTSIHGCKDTSTHNILIHALPVINAMQDQNLCDGTRSNPVIWSSSVANTQFVWTNDNTAIGLSAGGVGNIPSFTAINSNNYVIFGNITVTATANGCSVTQPAFAFAVNPVPSAVQAADQVVCNNERTGAVIFSNLTNAVASNSYAWTNNQPGIGLASVGNGNIPSFTATNNTNAPITATIQIVPTISGCPGPASTFTITVNPTPVVTPPTDRLACNGTNVNAIVFNGPTGADLYVWNNSDSTIGLPSNGTGNINAFQANNTTSSVITAQISVLPVQNGCFGATQSFTVTVNPTPSMNPVNNQQVCSGTSTQSVDFQSSVLGTTYPWVNNNNAIGLASSGSGSIPSFVPTNNSNDVVSSTITITPTFNGCPGPAQSFVISISPEPAFDQPANQAVCRGQQSPAIAFQSNVNGITYQWTNNNPAIGLSAQGTGNIPAFITQSTGNNRETAIITVSSNVNGCPGTDKIFEIAVEPIPEITQPSNLAACSGTTINPADFQSNVNTSVFSWTNSNTSIGLPASGSGNIPSFTASNSGSGPVTGIIAVTASLNGCAGMPQLFEILVNPLPVVDPISDKQVCSGKQVDPMLFSGNTAGSEYQWTNSNSSIGLASSGTGNISSFPGVNNTNQPVTATISVTAVNAQQCRSMAQQFSIVINPTPQLSASNDVTVCKGSTSTLTASGAQTYQWTPSIGLSCSNCANPVATVTDSLTYLVTGTNAYGCEKTANVKVNVIPNIEMLVSPNDTLCAGSQVQLYARGAERYEWSPAAGLNNAFSASPIATPTISTRYRVIGRSNGNCFSDTAYVFVQVAPNPGVNAGPDVEGATGSTVNLSATAQGNVTSWSWSPATGLSCSDCPNPVLTISSNTTYELTVKNRYGCTAKDSLRVITFCKNSQVFVPNAFSPDGDGVNDILMVRGEGISVKSFRIFNRWGNLVFERVNFAPNDPAYGWNGKVKGVAAAPDVFVYIAEVTCDNGTVYFHKGNTTLLK